MARQEPLFGDGGAVAARDAALAVVKTNAGPWLPRAWAAFVTIAAEHRGQTLTGEQLRLLILRHIGEPHHHNVWGAFIRDLVRAQLLVPTGRHEAMRTKRSHARRTPLYLVR